MQAEIDKINEKDESERRAYDVLKNQFDIILQDSNTIFNVDENNFVSYINVNEIQ